MDSTKYTSGLGLGVQLDLAPGTLVGEYVIEAKIGQGGFGAVYSARHPVIGKRAAVKLLAPRFSADPQMVERFVTEARAVNEIRHRNIIDIFSFGTLPDGRHYYVMALLDGEPLDRRLDRLGRFSLADALAVLGPIARALDAAHDAGIAHRDLKAENVFLAIDSEGVVDPKLLDFGIAKLVGISAPLEAKTQTGAPIGTPYYMSPEQARGRDVDHRTDMYAFGVLAYRMLTGIYPFTGDDYMTILMQQINDTHVPASTHVAELPERVDRVLAWLLHKEADHRPPTLATAVRALEGQPTALSAPPAITMSAWGDAPRARRRSVAGVVIAVAAVLAIGFGVVYLATRDRRAESPAVAPHGSATPEVGQIDAATAIVEVSPAAVVTIALDPVPAGATIKLAGTTIGTAPKVQLPRGTQPVLLFIEAQGFEPRSIEVMPDANRTIDARLQPLVSRPHNKPKRPTHTAPVDAGTGSADEGILPLGEKAGP